MRKRSKFLYAAMILLALVVLLSGAFLLYTGDYYRAGVDAQEAMHSTDLVEVVETDGCILFDGPGSEIGYVFYPGAKVETTAYAPIMQKIAEEGVDCFLVDMPFHLAFFGVNRADEVMEQYSYSYTKWYIGGHSLGGAMAASYASNHLQEIDGVILMAAYPTKSLDAEGFRVLSIYGELDEVLNMESLEKGREYMPVDYTEVELPGCNHAGFGDYGVQDGDGTAQVPAQEQQALAANYIEEFVVRSRQEAREDN